MFSWLMFGAAAVCFGVNLLFSSDVPGSRDFGWWAGVGVVFGGLGILEVL